MKFIKIKNISYNHPKKNNKNDYINNIIRLGLNCNEKCLFCNVSPVNSSLPNKVPLLKIKEQIKKLSTHRNVELSFSGGEPTLWKKDLLYLITYAKKIGIKHIQIQTNATLITKNYAKDLKKAGLNNTFVAFHSHIKTINDELTDLKNSYDMALNGIESLISERIEVTINTVINKLNYKYFPDFVSFINTNFKKIKRISLAVMQPIGLAKKNIYLLPKFIEIKPYITKGALLARKNNIKIDNHYCGLPLCFWDNNHLEECIEYNENQFLRLKKLDFKSNKLISLLRKEKMHINNCFNCYVKNFCNGIWKTYVDYYGISDVKPIKESLKWWF